MYQPVWIGLKQCLHIFLGVGQKNCTQKPRVEKMAKKTKSSLQQGGGVIIGDC